MSEFCSICGGSPAVCVDEKEGGTYSLCGACVGERMEELIASRARLKALEQFRSEIQRMTEAPENRGHMTAHQMVAFMERIRVAALAAQEKP